MPFKYKQGIARALKFASYKAFSGHKRGYGIHSPFVYQFVENVLRGKGNRHHVHRIEKLRENQRKNKSLIPLTGFGAGDPDAIQRLPLSRITGKRSISRKYGKILYQMVSRYRPKSIVELGTATGISTLYLAMPNPEITVYSVEGEEGLYRIAAENMQAFGLHNVHLIQDQFDHVCRALLREANHPVLLFLDGNHRKQSTLTYCRLFREEVHAPSMLVIDDINWSHEMEEAWNEICSIPEFTFTIDIFRMGIVFTHIRAQKQHFTINY